MRLDGANSFVTRDGSPLPFPRMVKKLVTARRNLSLIPSPDYLTQKIKGNRDRTRTRPGSQEDGRFPYPPLPVIARRINWIHSRAAVTSDYRRDLIRIEVEMHKQKLQLSMRILLGIVAVAAVLSFW